MIKWERFVAIGDSFSEGLWDFATAHTADAKPTALDSSDLDDANLEDPAQQHTALEGTPDEPPLLGWADRLAHELSARRIANGDSPLEYANLAIRGKKLRPIIAEQLPVALSLKPDLLSFGGGANDILRLNVDLDELLHNYEQTVARIRELDIDVLLHTGMNSADSPVVRHTVGRVALFNSEVWSMARRYGCYVLDLWGMRSLRDWRMWAPDRIHLRTPGHARVAQAGLVGLGLEPNTPDWDDPLAPQPDPALGEQVRENLTWAKDHLLPWVTRHLKGHSSGDGRSAKRPDPTPIVQDNAE